MHKITISGHPGSGTTTLVTGLKEELGWTSINGGEIFRNEANNRGLSLAQFGDLCSDDESVDLELDEILRQRILDSHINIVESRLAGWWAFKLNADCIRIWLNVSEKERAKRVAKREQISLTAALQANASRLTTDNERYQNMYGFLPEDPTPYTHIIEASDMTAQNVLEEAINIIGGS